MTTTRPPRIVRQTDDEKRMQTGEEMQDGDAEVARCCRESGDADGDGDGGDGGGPDVWLMMSAES